MQNDYHLMISKYSKFYYQFKITNYLDYRMKYKEYYGIIVTISKYYLSIALLQYQYWILIRSTLKK